MKKILLSFIGFLLSASLSAQETKAVKAESTSDIKELQATRDTLKAELRRKTLENTKDNNKFTKLQSDKQRLKDQLKNAKKSKKTEKIEALETKVSDNLTAIKELDAKIKEEEKELSKLEKDLKNADKALKTAKEKEVKEKAKARK